MTGHLWPQSQAKWPKVNQSFYDRQPVCIKKTKNFKCVVWHSKWCHMRASEFHFSYCLVNTTAYICIVAYTVQSYALYPEFVHGLADHSPLMAADTWSWLTSACVPKKFIKLYSKIYPKAVQKSLHKNALLHGLMSVVILLRFVCLFAMREHIADVNAIVSACSSHINIHFLQFPTKRKTNSKKSAEQYTKPE